MNYNKIAGQYDSFEKTAVDVWKIGYPAVLGLLGNVENRQVLDYGCGSGTFSRFLAEQGAIVTGVDVSLEMINVAKKDNPNNIQYHHITSGDTGFLPAATFDQAVANFVLCTIPTKAEIRKIMESVRRILKKEGKLVIMNANWERSNGKEFASFKMEYCDDLSSGKPVTATIKSDPPMLMKDFFWSKQDYLRMLESTGFHIQAIDEPVAQDDQIAWMDEKNFPPYLVIGAIK